MKIKQVKIIKIIINFNDLNVFVGKNDIGKSTILTIDTSNLINLMKNFINELEQ